MKIVIKIGTSTLTHPSGLLNIRHVEQIVKILSDLKNAGHDIVIVTSGAVGMGVGKLHLAKRPDDMTTIQACASVGQCEIMYTYDKLFNEYNHTVAQILLTRDNIDNINRRANFERTMQRLSELSVIPVINENDAIADEELKVGENDTLSAIVACSVKADLLILLSDIDGLYTADPHKDLSAEIIHEVKEITPEIEALAGGAGSALGTGGMATKISAAKMTMANGCDMVIANGSKPELLYDITEGKKVGTRFIACR